MQNQRTRLWTPAMFKQVYALPGSQRQPPLDYWNAELNLRERRTNMRRHVIRPLLVMFIRGGILGSNAREIRLQIAAHGRCGIFLNEEGGGRMTTEYRQQPRHDRLSLRPLRDSIGNLEQSLTLGSNRQQRGHLSHVDLGDYSCIAVINS